MLSDQPQAEARQSASKPFYKDDWLEVWHGDCRAVMAEMEPESVHCVVTSPPYWGLRDYGTATWVGGEAGCDHSAGNHAWATATEQAKKRAGGTMPYRGICGRCGATRIDAQLGLEPTPEEYVANLVVVFREVRRVLRADGTVWLNLGDSYAAQGGGKAEGQYVEKRVAGATWQAPRTPPYGLKPKDLVGIPWRVAFALQADGWYLRSDIIWSKPNPMPESVTDRPTKSHEYLFLLAKSARYYFDADAVREGLSGGTHGGAWNEGGYKQASLGQQRGGRLGNEPDNGNRNIRSVWTVATAPYPGSHFATFPPKLIEPCIKAGTSERGVCPECGAPWARVVERGELVRDDGSAVRLVNPIKRDGSLSAWSRPGGKVETVVPNSHRETTMLGWRPPCAHTAAPVPATVLDPFAGSGTTGMVTQSLSRRAVLIDLSLDYLGQLMNRNADIPLGLGA